MCSSPLRKKEASDEKNKLSWKRKGFILAFLAPTIVAFCLFYLYPIVTVFLTSFCKWDYTNITSPEFFGWKEMWSNYKYIFEIYPYFWEALRNSSLWAILGVVFQIPLATLIALAFSRKKKGVKLIRNIYIIPCMVSSAAIGMIFLQLYSPLYGIVNPVIRLFDKILQTIFCFSTKAGLLGNDGFLHIFTGTTTLMILGNIMAVPESVREAAMLDGASGLKQDWYITLPMIKGTLKTVSILAATSGFLLYNEVFFLTKVRREPTVSAM